MAAGSAWGKGSSLVNKLREQGQLNAQNFAPAPFSGAKNSTTPSSGPSATQEESGPGKNWKNRIELSEHKKASHEIKLTVCARAYAGVCVGGVGVFDERIQPPSSQSLADPRPDLSPWRAMAPGAASIDMMKLSRRCSI